MLGHLTLLIDSTVTIQQLHPQVEVLRLATILSTLWSLTLTIDCAHRLCHEAMCEASMDQDVGAFDPADPDVIAETDMMWGKFCDAFSTEEATAMQNAQVSEIQSVCVCRFVIE